MWLVAPEIKVQMDRVFQANALPTLVQQQEYQAQYRDRSCGKSSLLNISDQGVATLRIEGVLTKEPDIFALLFGAGNATYKELEDALVEAQSSSRVKSLELYVDSPGGHIDGLFDTIAALQKFSKPMKASVSNMATSAAYAIVCQADEIVATNPAARFGNIGVVASFPKEPWKLDVTNSQSPNKRPDVHTPEGKEKIVGELDALYGVFSEAIASGRRVTQEKVNTDFGQGATLLADRALEKGMIDRIEGSKAHLKVVKSNTKTKVQTEGKMDLNAFKLEHPELYNQVQKEAVTSERDRVTAHLTLGEASGDLPTAIAAIKNGDEMTSTLQATYMAAAINRKDGDQRLAEDQEAGGTLQGASTSPLDETDTEAQQVLALVEAQVGVAAEGA